jgi:hypothetical protein
MTSYLYSETRRSKPKGQNWLGQIPLNYLMGINIIALIINLLTTTSTQSVIGLSFWLFFGGIILVVGDNLHQNLNQFQKLVLKYGPSPIFFLIAFTILWLDFLIAPGAAQFFNGAESWMGNVFPGSDQVIGLIFNTLRGLMILYIGISLVKVVNAAREDDDWKSMARTPLLILLSVTVGDVLVGYIIGS